MATNKFLTKLSQNLLDILDDDEYYDITIEVGNDPDVKIFRAHMVILNYRSPYLRRILSTNKTKNDGTLTHIKLPNILPEIFQIILRYIYGGRISLVIYNILDIVKILVAANELSLQELIPHIQSFLIENKENWIEQNFNLIYQTSFENNNFLDLQKFCTELISKHPEKIFNSSDFASTPEKALISLIQHDNHQMTEVQVWEHVLKWGFAQNPGLSSDPSYYSNDDFNALKNTLQQCIPFMKFFDLTTREFLKNVFPYRKILPNELYVELLKLFLDNDYRPSTKKIVDSKNQHPTKKIVDSKNQHPTKKIVDSKIIKNQYPYKKIKYFDNPNNKSEPQLAKSSKNIDSIIITIQHAELILKWIDRLENTDELKNSYKFKLILRGSRDGFTAKRFHEICDDQSNTVTIIKVKDTNEILGGYNPIKWKSDNGYGITDDSFTFSFDKTRVESYILSRVKNENYAINYWHHYGPSFGGGDLIIYEGREGEVSFSNKTSYCYYEDSYEKQIRKTKEYFSVEEYEVFQIINNN